MIERSALLTDLYELTMAAVYLDEGMADRPATFSTFVRALPPGRGYLVAGGLDDVLTYLEAYRFTDQDLAVLDGLDLFDSAFLDYLGGLRFDGTVRAVPEGRIVFPDEPVLEIDAPIAIAQLLETIVLNQVTTQVTLCTKAARHRHAAQGRAVVDFGLRRTQGIDAGMKLVRAVAITGLDGTSNVLGGTRYDVPLSGTMAHAFVQAHPDETNGFRAFARRFRERAILLVDTYDTLTGVARAIEVARELRAEGAELRGVRLDSGDLLELATQARALLDEAGFPDLQIVASGGLDEHDIERLLAAGAPIDGFGVGSALGVSKDAPVLDSAYKLVAYDGRPVRKLSTGKQTWPGRKQVWRRTGAIGDVLGLHGEHPPADSEPLLEEVWAGQARTAAGRATLQDANERFERDWRRLPHGCKHLTDPDRYPVEPSTALTALAAEVDTELRSR